MAGYVKERVPFVLCQLGPSLRIVCHHGRNVQVQVLQPVQRKNKETEETETVLDWSTEGCYGTTLTYALQRALAHALTSTTDWEPDGSVEALIKRIEQFESFVIQAVTLILQSEKGIVEEEIWSTLWDRSLCGLEMPRRM